MRNKQDITVVSFPSVFLREIPSVKLRSSIILTRSFAEGISRKNTELIAACYLFLAVI